MKTIAGRARKILSRLFRVISVSAASLILQACYGMMPPDELYGEYGMPPSTSINGKVSAKNTGAPIPGIKVSIEETDVSVRTNAGGYFYLSVRHMYVYNIKFEDDDGPDNGGQFIEQTKTLYQNDTNALIEIELDS